jgi:peptidoglycan/xylan/chitin deacetylase (PgdA/CDA1 family)
MRLFRPIIRSRLLWPDATFRIDTGDNLLCLSFDDGPDPRSTRGILDILKAHNAKALFFCSGERAGKYPFLVKLIRDDGHTIGNHGYRHLSGWKSSSAEYISNVSEAAGLTSSELFRPPYGRIRPSQYRELAKTYRIIFWDLMPYDFDIKMGKVRTLRVLKNKIRPGAIIALHDSATSTLLSFLNEFMEYAEDKGYSFMVPAFSGKEHPGPGDKSFEPAVNH